MSDEEQIQKTLNLTLEELSKFSKALENKCARLIEQNNSNIKLDINCIKDVALKLVKTLRNSKGNILALLSFIEDEIKQVNAARESVLFQEIIEKIQESRTCSVISENGKVVFKQSVDKEVMVNLEEIVVKQDIVAESTSQAPGLQSEDEDTEEVKFIDAPAGDPSVSSGNVFTLDRDVLDLGPDPNNATDKLTNKNIVKDAEYVEHDNIIKSEDLPAIEDIQMKSEPAVEDSKSKYADVGLMNGEGGDSDSVWSNETIKEWNGIDEEQLSDECGSLELAPTQTIELASSNEETSENKNEKPIAEVSSSITEASDQDEGVSRCSLDTLFSENDPVITTDPSPVLVDTRKQGAESDGKNDQQKAHNSDKHSDNKNTEEKSKDEYAEDTLSLDILAQRDTSMDHVSLSDETDVGDEKFLTDKHDEKATCEKNMEDQESQSEKSTENEDTEKKPAEIVDNEEERMHNDKITEMDDIIIIDDDSSDEEGSEKEEQIEFRLDTELADVAGSQSVMDKPSNLAEQNVGLKESDLESLCAKDDMKQSGSMDLKRPVVEGGSAEDRGTNSDNKTDKVTLTDKVSVTLDDRKLLEENLANEDSSIYMRDSQKTHESDSNPQRTHQEDPNYQKTHEADPNPQKTHEGDPNYQKTHEADLNPQKTHEDDPNSQKTAEGDPNPQKTLEGDPNPQKTHEGDLNHQKTHEGDLNSQKTQEGDPNPQKTQESYPNPQQMHEDDLNPQKIPEGDPNPQKTHEGDLNPQKTYEDNPHTGNVLAEKDNMAIEVEKNKSGSQVTDASDSDTVTYDIEEALRKTDMDKVNTRDTNSENTCEQADVDHGEKLDVSATDSDATYIDSTQGTSKSQLPTVMVDHTTGKNRKSAANCDTPHSRPGSKLSDCESFVFDCSQNESVGENHSEVDDDLKQVHEPVDSKGVDNVPSSRCEVLEGSLAEVPDLEASTKDDIEDSQLVDVVMEEILDNRENTGKGLEPDTTCISVKEEPADRTAEDMEDDDEEDDEEEKGVGKLGDELLELFREVEMKKDGAAAPKKEEEEEDDVTSDGGGYRSDDAEAIFKAMQEDSTDTSESPDTDDDDGDLSILDDSDIELLVESKPDEAPDNTENVELKQDFMKTLRLKEMKMDRCYVRVERADFKKLSTTWRRTETEDSIDRLCDLSTINAKNAAGEEPPKPRHRKKRKKGGSHLSEDIFDSSGSGHSSDVEVWTGRGSSPDVSINVQQKVDAMLASLALKGIKDSDADTDTDTDTDTDDTDRRKTKKKDDRETKGSEQTKLTEEEKAKKKWRNDKLLREKLDSDDSSDSSTSSKSSDSSSGKRRKKKYEDDDPDYQVKFDEASDDELRKKRMSYKEDNLKKLTEFSDDSSDGEKIQLDDTTDDSDVEFVFNDVELSSPDVSSSQKGGHRRNIRALMSDADLERATLLAKEAEEQRIGRLKSRQKLRETLSQSLSGTLNGTEESLQDEDDEMSAATQQAEEGLVLDVDERTNRPLVQVDAQLTKILKSHQKAGIQFMWDCCYESLERIKAKDLGSGCILAHCMGLGKTLQVLALIHTLFAYKETGAKHALVVCPLSTVSNWKKEVRLRLKDVKKNFEVFTIGSTQEIARQKPILKQWYCAKRSILIMGYDRYECLTNEEKLSKASADFRTLVLNSLVDPGPDLIVCDEGHLLRSKKAVKVQALNKVRTKRRIVLTGTPLQNNLIEYYHMVQFVKPNLLGNLKEFKTNFVNPITNGQYEDSTKEDIKLMKKRTHVLHNYLKQTIQRFEDTELQTYLKKMHHYAVFVQLHPVQVEFYKKFLDIAFAAQQEEQRKTSKQKGFLSDFAVFQYICTHPYLLKIMDKRRNSNEREQDVIIADDVRPAECNVGKWWKDGMPEDAENAIEYGTKLLVVRHILEECEEIGDKVLIFSQSLGELDLIEHFLKNCGTSKCPSWKKDVDYTRMDGTVKPESRTGICDRFNNKSNTKLRLLLISIRVGGLGLNLTAANRVITMTVCWNPSYDLQSIFRVYRFGQEKPVYVYRLIALDTMEEKAYQRTVTKLAVAHRVIDKYQIKRHYKSVDLQAMYSCYPTPNKQRPMPNVPEDEVLAKLILKLPLIYKYHEQQALLANRPEDDLNEQEKLAAWEEFEKEKTAQKAAKEAAAMAATFAKEAAAASAEAMAALAATKAGGPVPLSSWGPTFNTAYSLCPPATSTSTGNTTTTGGHVTEANGAAPANNNATSQAPSKVVERGDHHPANNEGTNNGSGQSKAINSTTQAKNDTSSAALKFSEALEQLAKLQNHAARLNRKTHLPSGGPGGAQPPRPPLHRTLQQPLHRPRLPRQADDAPIDLTMPGPKRPAVVRGLPKDPLVTSSNGTENVAGPTIPHKAMRWTDRQKTNQVEQHLKNQNQKENQQQIGRFNKTSYKRNRDVDVAAASKAAQMDHAYSATKIPVKRKNDHLNTLKGAGVGVTSTTVPQKKARNNTVLRMNPCALLQPASARAIAAAAVSKSTPEGATIDLSDDEVELVSTATAPPKPPHDDIINTLSRSGITVTQLAPQTSDNRTSKAAPLASTDEVITLE